MSQYYYITIKAHVATGSDKGKAFIDKIKAEVEELRKMEVEPDFTCEDNKQGFTDIMLYFGDSFSGMIDSYFSDIMQEINDIGDGSYGCLMSDNEYGVSGWEAFGASEFSEVPIDDPTLNGLWGTDGQLILSIEYPKDKLLTIIDQKKFETAKANYENDEYEAIRRDALVYAINDVIDEDCDQTVVKLTSQSLFDALYPEKDYDLDSLFYLGNVDLNDDGLVSLSFCLRHHDIIRNKLSSIRTAFKDCAKKLDVIGGSLTFSAGDGYYFEDKLQSVLINIHDFSVFMFEPDKNTMSNVKVYKFKTL